MNNKHKGIFLNIGDMFKDMNGSEYLIEDTTPSKQNFNRGHSDSDKFWIVKKTLDKSNFKTSNTQRMSDLFLQGEIASGRAFIIWLY